MGNQNRREYTVMGDVVNLSARLMANAGRGGLLVDEPTYKCLDEGNWEVRRLDRVPMKGEEDKLDINVY
jgi:class 3 adenylate cyclase